MSVWLVLEADRDMEANTLSRPRMAPVSLALALGPWTEKASVSDPQTPILTRPAGMGLSVP